MFVWLHKLYMVTNSHTFGNVTILNSRPYYLSLTHTCALFLSQSHSPPSLPWSSRVISIPLISPAGLHCRGSSPPRRSPRAPPSRRSCQTGFVPPCGVGKNYHHYHWWLHTYHIISFFSNRSFSPSHDACIFPDSGSLATARSVPSLPTVPPSQRLVWLHRVLPCYARPCPACSAHCPAMP